MIHDNQLLRELLWKTFVRDTIFAKWLNAPDVETSPWFIPLSILIILCVFIAFALIEVLRLYLVEPLYGKAVKKLGKKIDDKVDSYIKKEEIQEIK